MDIREETINGITYIVETNDKGLVVKYPKYKGEPTEQKDPLTEIIEKLNAIASELAIIKEQTKT